jgi:ABC-type sulfate transport system permease component
MIRLLPLLIAAGYALIIVVPPLFYDVDGIPPEAYQALVYTALASTISTSSTLPPAILLSFYGVRRKLGIIIPITTFSTAIPHTALGLLLLPLYSSIGLVDTSLAIITSMMIVCLPIGVGAMTSMFSASNKALDEFLQPLGVGDLRIIRLYMACAARPVITAAILMWLRGFSELGVFLIVAQRPPTVGVYLYEVFLKAGASSAVPLALLLALTGFIFSTSLYLAMANVRDR